MEFERDVVQSIAMASGRFDAAVDALLCQLLHESGWSRRPTDGVTWLWETILEDAAYAFGYAILIEDQSIQPLRVSLTLDSRRERLAAGAVWFGDSHAEGRPIHSKEHRDLTKRMLLDPDLEFEWLEVFCRDATGWRRETRHPGLPVEP